MLSRHLLNVLRFTAFLPLSIGLISLMFWCIWIITFWLINLSFFWLIMVFLFGAVVIIGLSATLFGYVAIMLSLLNPYKVLGRWIIIPLTLCMGCYSMYLLWTGLDLSLTKGIIVALISTSLIGYTTIGFSILISGDKPEHLAGRDIRKKKHKVVIGGNTYEFEDQE